MSGLYDLGPTPDQRDAAQHLAGSVADMDTGDLTRALRELSGRTCLSALETMIRLAGGETADRKQIDEARAVAHHSAAAFQALADTPIGRR